MKRFLWFALLLIPALVYGKQKTVRQGAAPEGDKNGSAQSKTERGVESGLVMGSVAQWRAQAEDRYPALGHPESAFSVAFQEAEKRKAEDDPGYLLANDWPIRLAETVARALRDRPSHP